MPFGHGCSVWRLTSLRGGDSAYDLRITDRQPVAGLSRAAWRWGMSYVIAAPELMTSAATNLANIGSALTAAKAAAAAPTTGVLAAAEDEVSAAIAAVF